MLELERRFLVEDTSFLNGAPKDVIAQGYLFINDGYLVRVRRAGGSNYERDAMLAVKGPRRGAAREEHELPIPQSLAAQLFQRAQWKIFKIRYSVIEGDHLWDVDVFLGDNEGLAIAECEVEKVDQVEAILAPRWCGREITGDERYNNESLAMNPYSRWR